MKPLDLLKRSDARGTEGIKSLWEALPDVPLFEVPFPVERQAGTRMPLLTEASDPKFLHSYLRIHRTLSTMGELNQGRKLLLLDLSQSGERARRVAVNLSLVFAFEKLKVHLIDMDFRSPALHRLLGMRNLDGLLDHLVLGTPVADIIRETNIPGLSLITCGRQIDVEPEFIREIAWKGVLEELMPAEGISLSVMAKESCPEDNPMLPCFDGILLFFSERTSISREIRKWLRDFRKESHACGILWSSDILIDNHPSEGAGLHPAPERGDQSVFQSAYTWAGRSEVREPLPAARSIPEGGTMNNGDKDIVHEESPPQAPPEEPVLTPELGRKVKLSPPREGRGVELLGPVLLIFGLFVVILAGLLWWSGYFEGEGERIVLERPGVEETAPQPQAGTAEEPQTPPVEAPVAELTPPAGEVVTEPPPASPVSAEPAFVALSEADFFYTINVASYTDEEWAGRGFAKLAAAGVSTYLVPVDIAGKGTWIRLMLGSFGSKEDAQREMDRLMGEGVLKEGWVMQTPYAFLAGEWTDKGQAGHTMTSLIRQGLSPYLVSREEGGSARYRVFLGAFQGKEQASSLDTILKNSGHHFALTERRG